MKLAASKQYLIKLLNMYDKFPRSDLEALRKKVTCS